MRGKCYPHADAFSGSEEVSRPGKSPRWRVFAQFSENHFLMCHNEDGIVRYAPLCIHTFRLIAPRKLLEATQFNQQYRRYEEIQSVPDRLRWCRHSKGLMQTEVAEGEHLLELTLYVSRINTFGALHLCVPIGWKGPNMWYAEGSSWAYEYQLTDVGILKKPTLTLCPKASH